MTERTKFQQKAIQNYYDNRDTIALQRLEELVTELYLAEGKKRERHWKTARTHLAKLGVPQKQVDDLIAKDQPEALAMLVKKLAS